MRTTLLSLYSVAMLSLACGPMVMIPGGQLSGELTAVPDDWSFTDDVETVQLETRPSDPYSVNVWGVAAGDAFYIASGSGASAAWAQHIGANPHVRLRVGDALYELAAARTEDPVELDLFLEAAKQKYDFEPEPEQAAEAILFRLDPR